MGLHSSLYGSGPDEEEIFDLIQRADPRSDEDEHATEEELLVSSAEYQSNQDTVDEATFAEGGFQDLVDNLDDDALAALFRLIRDWINEREEDMDKHPEVSSD